MLGAQALRTKQRVDAKGREKRHRDHVQKREAQRDRIQKAANDDAAAAAAAVDQQQLIRDSNGRHSFHYRHRPPTSSPPPRRRIGTYSPPPPSIPICIALRSPSTSNSGSGNRLMKWLGLSSKSDDNAATKRRMSTY